MIKGTTNLVANVPIVLEVDSCTGIGGGLTVLCRSEGNGSYNQHCDKCDLREHVTFLHGVRLLFSATPQIVKP